LFQLERAIRLFYKGELLVNDQISTRGKATAKTPLKSKKASEKESSTNLAFSDLNWGSCTRQYFISVARRDLATLKEVVTMANVLVVPSMDSAMSEDGSFGEQMVEELVACADQRMSICKSISWFTHYTDKFDRILLMDNRYTLLRSCIIPFLSVYLVTQVLPP